MKIVVSILLLILISIPFFWMKPGEMDLGGDATRLYFYDPLSYFLHDGWYYFDGAIEGVRVYEPHFYSIPFVGLLVLVKYIIPSSYILIALFNGLKLAGGFFFVYLILKKLFHSFSEKDNFSREFAAILGGVFYIASPAMLGNYDKALLSHNQVFLNPLFFYLLLQFFLTKSYKLLWVMLLLSVIFAPNFSWSSAPPFFAFYPLSILFLILYVVLIQKRSLPVKKVILGIILLLGLHAFHLVPQMAALIGENSYMHERVFNQNNIAQQIQYFYSVLSLPKLSMYFFADASIRFLHGLAFLSPLIVLLGLFLTKAKNKTIALTGCFFLITLFLVVGKITDLGPFIYSKLFYLPGFTMFRNFTGQWQFVFFFFYALLFGQALYVVPIHVGKRIRFFLILLLFSYFVISSRSFITGELVNKVHFQSDNVKIAFQMDPAYEKVIEYIRNKTTEGNILAFPLSDCCYQVVSGSDGGAYVGPSPFTYLTDKKDYNGYLILSPFSDAFITAAKQKDYERMERIMALLNIRYIFYNNDQRIYDDTFPSYPFEYMRQYLPKDQKDYEEFLKPLVDENIFSSKHFSLYHVKDKAFLPTIYIAEELVLYQKNKEDKPYTSANAFYKALPTNKQKTAFIEKKDCHDQKENLCETVNNAKEAVPTIAFEKVNATKYQVRVSDVAGPYMLVLSQTYDPNWKVFFSQPSTGMQEIAQARHTMVNGYANAWVISPEDTQRKKDYELVIELVSQRNFYYSMFFSFSVFILFIIWGIILFFNKKNAIMKKIIK